MSYSLIALFSFCFSVSLGAVWEVFRFFVFSYLKLRVGDYNASYTPQVLLFTMLGACIASFLGYIYLKRGRGKFLQHAVKSFMHINPHLFKSYKNSSRHILDLIKKGENEKIEFKSTFRTNLHTKQHDKKMEYAVLKTINAFLNSDGGTLIVGISDKGNILGLEHDGFENNDLFYRHFTNLLKSKIGSEYISYVDSEIIKLDDNSILKIDCAPSKKEVFLKDGNNESFYVRAGPSSVKIEGSKLIEYVNQRFKKN